jgi:GntR family transcriptional regulator
MSVDDIPLGYVVSCVPARLGRKIPAARLEDTALVLLLSELCGTRIVRADQWTIASSASRHLSDLLEIRLGDPVLMFRRVYFDRQGCPVQTSSATFRGDRFRQYLHLRQAVQDSETIGPEALDPDSRPGEDRASIPQADDRAVPIF